MNRGIYTLGNSGVQGLLVKPDIAKSQFRVRIAGDMEFSNEVDQLRAKEWDAEVERSQGKASENTVLGHSGVAPYVVGDGATQLDVLRMPYSAAHFLNQSRAGEGIFKRLLTIGDSIHYSSTHAGAFVRDENGELYHIWATKKNIGKSGKMSNFGGFPNKDFEMIGSEQFANIGAFLQKRNLPKELGPELMQYLSEIRQIGSTLVIGGSDEGDLSPKLAHPSGIDTNYNLYFEGISPNDFIDQFRGDSDQFKTGKKDLEAVVATPEAEAEFIVRTYESGGEVSPFAFGHLINYYTPRFESSRVKTLVDAINSTHRDGFKGSLNYQLQK